MEYQNRKGTKPKGASKPLQSGSKGLSLKDQRGLGVLQKKTNSGGLPNALKEGIENLSGYAMDDVKVHYNSSKPAQLNAHAYAQGNQIHLANGQEKHLPHEAWHVVQQKQGRVKPTYHAKNVAINDSNSLEREADVMGHKVTSTQTNRAPVISKKAVDSQTVQRFPFVRENKKSKRVFSIQLKGNDIDAIQIAGNKKDLHSGSLNFSIEQMPDRKAFVLSHIISDPELGSGLGALLVYYMCKIARAKDFKTIEIFMAAPMAVGFYEHMGWKPNKPMEAERHADKKLTDEDENSVALDKYIEHMAKVKFNSDPENRTLKKRDGLLGKASVRYWGDSKFLDSDKEKLLLAERLGLEKEGPLKKQQIARMMHRNTRVGQTGLIGDTEVILAKAFASVQNTWIDSEPNTWEKAWDSRMDTKRLTEFPKHPDDK